MDLARESLLTEEQIDQYYDNLYKIHMRRKENIVKARTKREDRRRLAALVGVVLLITMVIALFLKVNNDVTSRLKNITALEREVEELKLANADTNKRINDSENINMVKSRALKMGMSYPSASNIVYYEIEDGDFMFQMATVK